jgi:para-nitrobenzyl esterase
MPKIKHRLLINRSITALIICAAVSLAACDSDLSSRQPQQPNVPTLEASGISYHGRYTLERGVQEFLGIPFAQAPINDLRWAPPIPVAILSEQASQTVAATEFAPACLQGPHLANWYKNLIDSFGGDANSFPTPSFSEDCLYLNVWSPKPDASQKKSSPLPVLVFIHGGSNKGGWSYEPNYLGERLASKGVVVVSIAYRVGALGFFSHPELQHANFGLLDQIAGLNWIQQNIAKVGGDPNNITVAGESSGASNIGYLMASHQAKGLFQRAIHQSAGWAMYATDHKSTDEKKGLELAASALGSSGNNDIEQLRQLSSEDLLVKIDEVYKDHSYDPVIDGHSVTQAFAEAAKQGQLNELDLLIGSNANEARMYLGAGETIDSWIADNLAEKFPDLSKSIIQANLAQDSQPLEQLDQLATSFNYTCPSLNLAQIKASFGGQTWFYHFTKQRDGDLGAKMGSYHGAELPYVFNTHDDWLPTSTEDRMLTDSIMQYWVNFIRTGNPNSAGLPEWKAYQKHSDPVQFLGIEIKSQLHPSAKLCRLFES